MVSYYTIIAWMQMRFGMFGLAMTELYLLLLSVGITVLAGRDFAEVFPVKNRHGVKYLGHFCFGRGVCFGPSGNHGDRMVVSGADVWHKQCLK